MFSVWYQPNHFLWNFANRCATEHPFQGPNLVVKLDKIDRAEVTMPDFISPEAKDLVLKILRRNPKERPSVKQLWSHPWVAKDSPDGRPLEVAFEAIDPGIHERACAQVQLHDPIELSTLTQDINDNVVSGSTSLYYLFVEKFLADKVSDDIAAAAARCAQLAALMKPKGKAKGKGKGKAVGKPPRHRGQPPPLKLDDHEGSKSWLGSPAFLRKKKKATVDDGPIDGEVANERPVAEVFQKSAALLSAELSDPDDRPARSESMPGRSQEPAPRSRLRNASEPAHCSDTHSHGPQTPTLAYRPRTSVPTPDGFNISTDIDTGERVLTPVKSTRTTPLRRLPSGGTIGHQETPSPRARSKSLSACENSLTPQRSRASKAGLVVVTRRTLVNGKRKEVSRVTSRRALLALRRGTPLKETTFGSLDVATAVIPEEGTPTPGATPGSNRRQGSSDDLVLACPRVLVEEFVELDAGGSKSNLATPTGKQNQVGKKCGEICAHCGPLLPLLQSITPCQMSPLLAPTSRSHIPNTFPPNPGVVASVLPVAFPSLLFPSVVT